MKVLGWVAVGVLAIAGLLSLDPAVVGLSETTPVLQAIALRGVLAVAGLGLGLVLLLVALLLRRTAGKGRRLLALGLLAVVVGVGHGGVLLERGLGTDEALPPKPSNAVDVLTLNTEGTAEAIEDVVTYIGQQWPDVIALQETPADDAERIAAELGVGYQVLTATTGPNPVQATALLVADTMGEYEQAEPPATTFGGVWATPVDGVGPQLFSVHAVPPLPGNTDTWREEITGLTGLCARVDGVIMAGDFNATVDHAALRDATCADGAVGTGGAATWPADQHPIFGTVIDHVLFDSSLWRATDSRVFDVTAGDHRALLVRVLPVR